MIPGVSNIKDFSSNGISIISKVVPGKRDVVTTSFSPTLCSINLLINVDFPTFVVPTMYTSSLFLTWFIDCNNSSIPQPLFAEIRTTSSASNPYLRADFLNHSFTRR